MPQATIFAQHHRSTLQSAGPTYQWTTLDQAAGVGYDPTDAGPVRTQCDWDVVAALPANAVPTGVRFACGVDSFNGATPLALTLRASTGPLAGYANAQALHIGSCAGTAYGSASIAGDIDVALNAAAVAALLAQVVARTGTYSLGLRATDESGASQVSATLEGLDYTEDPAANPRLIVDYTVPSSPVTNQGVTNCLLPPIARQHHHRH